MDRPKVFARHEPWGAPGGMSVTETLECPRCKARSAAGAAFCHACGGSLETAMPVPLSPAVEAEDLVPVVPGDAYEDRRAVDRTRTGVLLLAIGAFLSWIPIIGLLGGLLTLVGAILVILGREPFGDAHARNVGIAIVLFIFGLIAAFALAGGVLSAAGQAAYVPPSQAESIITSAFSTLLVGAIILGIVTGPASVFFLWELLNVPGKMLILLSYISGILISYAVYVIIMAQLATALSSAFAVSPPDPGPIVALDAQVNTLKLLDALPSLLAAGAAAMAWSRIESGEIPRKLYSG